MGNPLTVSRGAYMSETKSPTYNRSSSHPFSVQRASPRSHSFLCLLYSRTVPTPRPTMFTNPHRPCPLHSDLATSPQSTTFRTYGSIPEPEIGNPLFFGNTTTYLLTGHFLQTLIFVRQRRKIDIRLSSYITTGQAPDGRSP